MLGKVGLVIAGVIVAAALWIVSIVRKTPTPQTTVPPLVTNEAASSQQASSGRYIPYSKEAFDREADKKRILYFHADWCPTCRPLDQAFSTMTDKIPSDVVIFKANYDTESELKTKHAITYQHTFVQVDGSGNTVAKWSGGNFEDVLSQIQ